MQLSRRTFFGVGGSVLASGLIDGAAAAETETRRPLPGDLRQRLLDLMKKCHVPGLAIAGVRKGEVVFADALGFASLPFRVPADERTLFHMGSVGKHFTAAAVLKLVEAGQIALDRPIGEYVKDVPKQFAACPIHSLLSHTSGIPTYDELPGMEGDRKVERGFFMKAIGTLPLDFAPGESWAYSNTGFVLLGRAVEDVTKRTYRQVITEDFLAPAKLAEGRVDDAEAVILGRADPYVLEGEEIRHGQQMNGDFSGWPDGGIILSPRDTATWEIGLQRGSPVTPATIKRMTEPALFSSGRSTGYGCAWFLDRMAGHRMHYHSGTVSGFIAFWLRLPDHETGVIAMVNMETDAGRAVRQAAVFEVAELLAPGSTCWALPPLRDDDAALTERTRRLFADGAHPGDTAVFAPEISRLRGRVAFAQATGFDEKIQIEPGAFKLVEAFDEPGDSHVRRYRASMPAGAVHYDVGYDGKGRIFRIRDV